MNFTHLHVHSNFSFKDSTCSIDALCQKAAELGFASLAITDHNNLCGVIRFYKSAKKHHIKPIIGVEITLEDYHLTLLAKDMAGYSNLCRLITEMHLSNTYGQPICTFSMLAQYCQNLICLSGCNRSRLYSLLRQDEYEKAMQWVDKLTKLFGTGNFYIEMQNRCTADSATMLKQLHVFARKMNLPVVATNNVHFIGRKDHMARDIMVCMSNNIPMEQPHSDRHSNDQCYLKSGAEMRTLFAEYPEAIANTERIAAMCNVELPLGEYRFPYFELPPNHTANSYLRYLCRQGLTRKYALSDRKEANNLLEHELKIIMELGFSEYFLVVWDIGRFARSNKIRYSGRGSAVGSIVAYLLDITHVCPIKHNLLFERFLNPERKGMPDIDIDFDSARRDEVIEYIYNKYDADKVAMVCTVNTISARSALREVGKAMGFSKREIGTLAKYMPHVSARKIREAMINLPELEGHIPEREPWSTLLNICEAIDDAPRHLGTHLGGVVIGSQPLTDLVPLQRSAKGVVITQYDKDDIEDLGLVKMDILGLRILSVIDQSAQMAGIDIDNIPLGDEKTFQLLRTTHTVGLFQLESPGMRNLLGRLQPTEFTDITANISLFRPGPMKANMVKPFVERRHGKEKVEYPHPALEEILRETYGVIVYQEQVLRIAHRIAGFSLGQSDLLRRAMTHNRSPEEMQQIKNSFIKGALDNGVNRVVAEQIFKGVAAFAAYGFNKAHAAAFAWLAYQTAYLKAHCPAQFLASILNNQPMGFYPPRVIVNEARRMGIKILPIDISASEYRCTVDDEGIRIGLMYVHNLSKVAVVSIITARRQSSFTSPDDFIRRTKIPIPILETLIRLGALSSLGSIEELLFHFDRIANMNNQPRKDAQLMFNFRNVIQLPSQTTASKISLQEQVAYELEHCSCSISAHPLHFFKERIPPFTVKSKELRNQRDGTKVWVAGTIVSRQTPPTKSGKRVIFITIEDETGLIDLTVFPKVQLRADYAKVALRATGLLVKGTLQRMGMEDITVIAESLHDLAAMGKAKNINIQKSSWNEVPGGRSKIVPT